ncbi:MAG: TrmJ/YjtD family RNA methyltransferase [Promethearchaeota archaeon]|nr:MAG: TrmJ/YjtD family RNA methyltransferase [Candidatus Lokiarchaeota archaeon]
MNLNKKRKFREIQNFKETQINQIYQNLSFTIILIETETAGNIGAIARVMKNFDLKNLVIFNPIEKIDKILSDETCGFAMHGKDILFKAKIIIPDNQDNPINDLNNLLKNFDLVIGTTAKGKKYTNLRRLAIFPEDLSIPISEKPLEIAILFGKESHGLTNDEIGLADIILRIPTSQEYSSLNLSHACSIILYEIFKKINILNVGRGKNPVLLADKEDRVILYDFIKETIEVLKLRTYKEDYVYQAFKNAFERAILSKKELSLILGLFSKVNSILNEIRPYEDSKI